MGLIAFLLLCVVVGVITWAAVTYVPMPPQFKTALPIMAIIVLILILLIQVLGGMNDVAIPKLR